MIQLRITAHGAGVAGVIAFARLRSVIGGALFPVFGCVAFPCSPSVGVRRRTAAGARAAAGVAGDENG